MVRDLIQLKYQVSRIILVGRVRTIVVQELRYACRTVFGVSLMDSTLNGEASVMDKNTATFEKQSIVVKIL